MNLTREDWKNVFAYLRIAQLRAQRISERATSPDVRREQLRRCRELHALLEKIAGCPIDPPQAPNEQPTRPHLPTINTANGSEKRPQKRGRKPRTKKEGAPNAPPQ